MIPPTLKREPKRADARTGASAVSGSAPWSLDTALAALAAADVRLAAVVARTGPVPARRRPADFSGLASIIVAQMVSRQSAAAIWQRLELETGDVSAANFAALDASRCRAIGLSRAKEESLRAAADAVSSGAIDLPGLGGKTSDAAIGELTAIRGIGPWTAEVYLLFCLGHPDVFPAGDIALQNAVAHAFDLRGRPDRATLQGMADGWKPWRGAAAHLFWAYYAACMKRDGLPVAATG